MLRCRSPSTAASTTTTGSEEKKQERHVSFNCVYGNVRLLTRPTCYYSECMLHLVVHRFSRHFQFVQKGTFSDSARKQNKANQVFTSGKNCSPKLCSSNPPVLTHNKWQPFRQRQPFIFYLRRLSAILSRFIYTSCKDLATTKMRQYLFVFKSFIRMTTELSFILCFIISVCYRSNLHFFHTNISRLESVVGTCSQCRCNRNI